MPLSYRKRDRNMCSEWQIMQMSATIIIIQKLVSSSAKTYIRKFSFKIPFFKITIEWIYIHILVLNITLINYVILKCKVNERNINYECL